MPTCPGFVLKLFLNYQKTYPHQPFLATQFSMNWHFLQGKKCCVRKFPARANFSAPVAPHYIHFTDILPLSNIFLPFPLIFHLITVSSASGAMTHGLCPSWIESTAIYSHVQRQYTDGRDIKHYHMTILHWNQGVFWDNWGGKFPFKFELQCGEKRRGGTR